MRDEIRTATVSHQNVRLSHGRHRSPDEGACILELASMLAGERFSDHPRAVCPVIAGFLRSVNDQMPEDELPELYPFAARIVGTRGPWRERSGRVRECAVWADDLGADRRILAIWLGHHWGWGGAEVGSLCARAAMREGGHNLALALLEGLLPQTAAHTGMPTVPSTQEPERRSQWLPNA